jgi:hypothetical protein
MYFTYTNAPPPPLPSGPAVKDFVADDRVEVTALGEAAIFHSVVYNCCLTSVERFGQIHYCDPAFITKQMLRVLGLLLCVKFVGDCNC